METLQTIVNHIFLWSGIGLLIYDAILELTGRDTISRWYQKLFPRWADWLIFAVGMVGLCLLTIWIHPAIITVWAGFWGHVTVANKERYGE